MKLEGIECHSRALTNESPITLYLQELHVLMVGMKPEGSVILAVSLSCRRKRKLCPSL